MYETATVSHIPVSSAAWPQGPSDMAERIRKHDWAATPLGPVETWPQSLRTTVELVLGSGFPMVVLWGDKLIQIYNDGCRDLMGHKYPTGLGQPTRDCWPEVWHVNQPIYERVRAGETLTCENALHSITRSGKPEDAWFASSHSPLRDETGTIAGVLVTLFETTEHVLAEQRHGGAEAALRKRETQYQSLFKAIEDGCWLADVLFDEHGHPFDILFIETNLATQRMIGRDLAGMRVSEIGAYEPYWFEAFGRVAQTGKSERHEHYAAGEDRWYEFHVFKPDPDDSASIRIATLYRDVTERKRAEQAREGLTKQLVEERTRLESLIENLPVGIAVVDREGTTLLSNPAFRRYRPDGVIPSRRSDDREEWIALDDHGCPLSKSQYPGARALRGELVTGIEFLHRTPDGEESWTRVSGVPLLGPDGQLSGALTVIVDIDEIKRSEEHQRLLTHELNHRVKNTLATVQSIATQTLRNAPTMEDAKTALEARLLALSRAHDVLTRENWDGAELREIAAQAVEPYSSRYEERLHLSGPKIRLSPRMSLALAMVLQELATNAVKYGALSNATGEIRITWRVDDGAPARLQLHWKESGGPSVEAPTRRGFGTRLIERSLAQDLDGDVRIEFAAAGVTCVVDAPIV